MLDRSYGQLVRRGSLFTGLIKSWPSCKFLFLTCIVFQLFIRLNAFKDWKRDQEKFFADEWAKLNKGLDAEFGSNAILHQNFQSTIRLQTKQLCDYEDSFKKLEAELRKERGGNRPALEALEKAKEDALAQKEAEHKEALAAQQKTFDDRLKVVQAEKETAEAAKANLEREVDSLKASCSELRQGRAALILNTEAQMFPKIKEAWGLLYPDQSDQEEAERLIRRINWVGSRVSAEAVGKTIEPYASDSDDDTEEDEAEDEAKDGDGDAADA